MQCSGHLDAHLDAPSEATPHGDQSFAGSSAGGDVAAGFGREPNSAKGGSDGDSAKRQRKLAQMVPVCMCAACDRPFARHSSCRADWPEILEAQVAKAEVVQHTAECSEAPALRALIDTYERRRRKLEKAEQALMLYARRICGESEEVSE